MSKRLASISASFLVVALFLLAAALPAKAEPVLVGVPFIAFTVTPNPGTVYDEPSLSNAAGVWLQFKHPSIFGNIDVNRDVIFYDQKYNISGSTSHELSLSLSFPKFNNGLQCVYLLEMADVLTSGVFSLNYTVTNVVFNENPSPTVAIIFSSFGSQYSTFFTATVRVDLSFSPSIGTDMSFSIANPNVDVVPKIVTIAYPLTFATVVLRANGTGTYLFDGRLEGGSDLALRYDFDVSLQRNTFTVIPAADLTVTEATTPTYAATTSDPYAVSIPSTFLYSSFIVSVRVHTYPPGLVVSPSTLLLTRRGVPSLFTVSGSKGLYSLKYVVLPANDGRYLDQPPVNTSVLIRRKLNITVAKVPDAYAVNKYFSPVYGGAFSIPVTVTVEASPKKLLVVQIIAEDSISSPAFLTFAPGGVTSFTFSLQAKTPGVKQLAFRTTGLSVLDYVEPRPRYWKVWGPNKHCAKEPEEEPCFRVSGCNWNAQLGLCSNRSLPIAFSPIPLLFNLEPRGGLFFTLPTPVRRGLTVTFDVASRLKFTPSVIDLPPGATVGNFSLFPTLLPRDTKVSQMFTLILSGADANTYVQQVGSSNIRTQIKCFIAGPWSIFVRTNSTPFSITCDTPPETYTTFLPTTVQSTLKPSLLFDILGELAADNVSAQMVEPNVSVQFQARSVSDEARIFFIAVTVGGPNAFRYAPIEPVAMNVLPPGELNVLPHFVVEAFQLSPPLRVDLSIVPDKDMNVTFAVVNASSMLAVSTDDVWITPNISYNNTKLGVIRVLGRVPGKYFINYTLGGSSLEMFILPGNSSFNVTTTAFANAFLTGQELGFQPMTRCRVNVGRDSEFFPGQTEVSKKQFCDLYDRVTPSNTTVPADCASYPSQNQCRMALQDTGFLCVWNSSAAKCLYLESLQGLVADVAYGQDFILLLTTNRTVWSMGKNQYGQLGHLRGAVLGEVPLPVPIFAIVAGLTHSLAMGQGGVVYGWGNNNMGQLGRGTVQGYDVVPALIPFPRRETINCLSSGALHAAALSATGTLYTWGSNQYGQLGTDAQFRSFSRLPAVVPRELFDGDALINVQCGFFHTMVATDIATYSFGRNTQGQLGRPGYDETVPAFPILRAPTPFIPMPQYKSALHGNVDCVDAV